MTKIHWEGWHQFTGVAAFIKFSETSMDQPYNTIMWITLDCPIVIWLN